MIKANAYSPPTSPQNVLERLMRPLVTLDDVVSLTVFEHDGFVIYQSENDSNLAPHQLGRWIDLLSAAKDSKTLTLVLENGHIILRKEKEFNVVLNLTRQANLGRARQTLEDCIIDIN